MVKTWLSRFQYPKLLGLILAILLAYIIFQNPEVSSFVSGIGNYGYLGVFIGGMLFAFGFTAPFAAGFFISLTPTTIWLAGFIGGVGALVSDLLIFKFIKLSFKDEFDRLRKENVVKNMEKLTEKSFIKKIKIYLIYVFAGILIASPLPDEIGVTLLAGLSSINIRVLAVISFILNTLGIMVLLLI
ncbi:hypothetical protein A3K73_03045 [Candidatus Pacearchaeota archaeon RBG_13_36_9]|nr:MAG: hypothetical protein A3K73_03045 [Candidatus Pacearchaeota archaeon RBG_13_36_9]